jgi:type 1 fimbriae regulatory protein FimB
MEAMMEFLTSDELLSVLRTAHKASLRDHLLILMAYSHGLRASEAVNIKLTDIQDGSLTIVRLKGSNKTVQPLVPHRGQPLLDEVKSLKEYLKVRAKDSGDVLFPSMKGGSLGRQQFYTLFNRYSTEAGMPESKRNPHILKHTAANHLVRAGLDVAFVQARLGHADIGSTMYYVTLNDTEVAEKAHDALMRTF